MTSKAAVYCLLVPAGTIGAVTGAQITGPRALLLSYLGTGSDKIVQMTDEGLRIFSSPGIDTGYAWRPGEGDLLEALAPKGICNDLDMYRKEQQVVTILLEWLVEKQIIKPPQQPS